jgi:CheY-like chemotaxis protein
MTAAGGDDAIAIAAAESYDLLLTDVVMPGLSGPDLAQQLRRGRPDLPVVFMSGYSAGVLDGDLAALGASSVIQKPFTQSDLRAALGRALGVA